MAGTMRSAARVAAGFVACRARGRPFTLSHLVTSRCQARCPTCLWRGTGEGDLPTGAVVRLYRDAAAAGIRHLVVWGGEPLVRADLPRLLQAAADAGLVVTLITNGWLLEERWPEIRGSVAALILSLDDAPPAHDRRRGLPGLGDRLERAVGLVRQDALRPRLLVNTVLSTGNRGALERVAPIARRWGAGLYFCPMESGRLLEAGYDDPLAHLALTADELIEAAERAEDLLRAGYPIRNSPAYLRLLRSDPHLRSYRCRAPRAVLTVEADGAVRDCRRRDVPLADVARLQREGLPLSAVFSLPRYRAMLAEADGCTACNNPDVIETSWLWDLRPAMAAPLKRLLAGGPAG